MNEINSQYKKGAEGEKYITSKLAELNYKVMYVGGCQMYFIGGNRFETVDLEVFKNGRTFWVQVKYKEPRTRYPDTGMEKWRYEKLVDWQKLTGLKTLVLFTDSTGAIYGEWIDNLPSCKSEHPGQYNSKTQTPMIYWLRAKLKNYRDIL